MKYIWRYSKETEAANIIFTCSSLSRKFYFKAGYFVTSNPLSYVHEKSVYLPAINYNSIKNFWRNVSKKEYNVGEFKPKDIVTEISQLLPENELLKEKEIEKIKKNWEKVKNEFEKYYKFMFPKVYQKVKKILIMPTKYGSIGSYSYQKIQKEQYIPVYVRSDCPIDVIIHLILLATVHHTHFLGDPNERKMIKTKKWFKKQEIADFLIRNTSFKTLTKNFPKDTPISDEILKESKKYLQFLGFYQNINLSIKGKNVIETFSNRILKNFTKSEENILKLLIRHKSRITSFEQIAMRLWGKRVEKKYSLYAITRLIADLRQKIRDNGIYNEVIHTQRGKGYVLYD
jgi:hypothetical protein